jgi:hypothetical protein
MSTQFKERMATLGLKLPEAEIPKLEALVADLDKAAEVVRIARPYAEEPLSAFHLPRP